MDIEKQFKKNVSLASCCSYEIGGVASWFYEPGTEDDLAGALRHCRRAGMPYTFFGLGSNTLFPDNPAKDRLFLTARRVLEMRFGAGEPEEPASGGLMYFSAGVPLTFLAAAAALLGNPALYFTYLLPGTLGAGIYMNARYFQEQVGDIVESVYFIDLDDPDAGVIRIGAADCCFGYKASVFQKKKWVITGADIRFPRPDRFKSAVLDNMLEAMKEGAESRTRLSVFCHFAAQLVKQTGAGAPRFAEIDADRACKKHFDFPSCGSVFKNNHSYGTATGVLVDRLGLKGAAHGGAQIAPHHGNIIINNGGAKAADVIYLVRTVQDRVNAAFGFVPEPELVIAVGAGQ